MSAGAYKICPICRMQRAVTPVTKLIKKHKRWDAAKGKMVACAGSMKRPATR